MALVCGRADWGSRGNHFGGVIVRKMDLYSLNLVVQSNLKTTLPFLFTLYSDQLSCLARLFEATTNEARAAPAAAAVRTVCLLQVEGADESSPTSKCGLRLESSHLRLVSASSSRSSSLS